MLQFCLLLKWSSKRTGTSVDNGARSKNTAKKLVENVAPLCLRSDLAVVKTNRQSYICSWISLPRLFQDQHHLWIFKFEFLGIQHKHDRLGRTATPTQEVEVQSCADYPRAFPFWNDVPVLLLNQSIECSGFRLSRKRFETTFLQTLN